MELPEAAGAVVIGGGVIGCSAAYHLAKMGCRDVVIVERRRLTCGKRQASLACAFGVELPSAVWDIPIDWGF